MSATFDLIPETDRGLYAYVARCACSHGSIDSHLRLGAPWYTPGTPAPEDLAADTYANLLRQTGCDDALEMGNVQVPDNPTLPPLEQVTPQEEPAPDPRASTISFTLTPVIPPWHHAVTSCPHGMGYNGVWIPGGAPQVATVKASSYANHHVLMQCNCVPGGAASSATVTLGPANAVPRGSIVSIPQTSGTVNGPGLQFTSGKLRCIQAGLYAITISFYLSRSVAQGAVGRGHIWVAGSSVASLPLTDVNGRATANVSWSGQVSAAATIEAAYENNSVQVQDAQGGSIQVQSA